MEFLKSGGKRFGESVLYDVYRICVNSCIKMRQFDSQINMFYFFDIVGFDIVSRLMKPWWSKEVKALEGYMNPC